jgi:hypothetical protein
MDIIKPIPAIPNALARSDGMIKFADTIGKMPHGALREYKTKWLRGTITKASKNARHTYYGTMYSGKNYKVHRLVCEAFFGPAPEGKNVVIHLDEDATNNRPSNLKWGTQKENLNAPGFIAYCKSRTGENSPTTKGRRKRLDKSE